MLPICTLQGPQQVDTVEGRKMVSEPLSPQNLRCKDVLHILAEIRHALDLQVEFESFAEKQNYFQVSVPLLTSFLRHFAAAYWFQSKLAYTSVAASSTMIYLQHVWFEDSSHLA
ncbi:hypothetical protein EJB05_22518 [Eragrostis curvula]|uniref:Uncharacterized protein n=1 Tax=Eragrostis curvula TaxID=38414 RepID=A0A5J9V661_9POAL|nr:hypothetical protein EJB05_22518 [Eragrostis curvula]